MDINKFAPSGVLRHNHLLSLENYSEEDVFEILHRAKNLARIVSVGEKTNSLKGKQVALITKKGLTRTRIAFERAVSSIGGVPVVCAMSGSELEALVKDRLTVAAIAGYGVNAIVVQTSEITDAAAFEKLTDMPVISANGKSGPCEALSALMTVWRKKGKLGKMKVAMIGDPAAYADSFVYAFAASGFGITFVCPEQMKPTEETMNYCRQFADVETTDDLAAGLSGAEVVFVSEDDLPESFRLTRPLFEAKCPGAIILHTLPVAENGAIASDLVNHPAFCGLDEALCLPEIEMAVISLLVAK